MGLIDGAGAGSRDIGLARWNESTPKYKTGWWNNFKNSFAGGGLTGNQQLVVNDYTAFNNGELDGVTLEALNNKWSGAQTAGAFNTSVVGDSIKEGLATGNTGNGVGLLGNISTGVNILSGINGIMTARDAAKATEKQLAKENTWKQQLMDVNMEKYSTYKADKAKLNASYGGSNG